MITSRIYRDGELQKEAPFDPADVEACRADGSRRIWIDVVEPTDDELDMLQRVLDLHELSVEDSRRWGQRSKVEFYSDYVFVVVHGLQMGRDDEVLDSELHLFAGQRFYLLTIQRQPLIEFRTSIARVDRGSRLIEEGIGYQLYLLLDEIVDGYLDLMDRLEDLSDDLEERVFEDEEAPDLQASIFRLKRKAVLFRRVVAPLREVIDLLSEHEDLVTQPLIPYYRDVLDHVIRSIELVDNIRELLTSALEARLAQASNRLNIVMKQLSGWAAIILIPTLVAGIYGMNFRHMPELHWRLGYPLALVLMVSMSVVLYLVFKRRRWI